MGSSATRGARRNGFPAQGLPGDIETHFTLSRADRRQVSTTASPANRLGFALQLGAIRFLGFCPDVLGIAPEAVVAAVPASLISTTMGMLDGARAAGTVPTAVDSLVRTVSGS